MVGIMGTKTVIKTGSFNSKFIPSLHVLLEDNLAKLVVDCLCESEPYFSRKYIMSGAWANQASCLYGFYTYGMEMEAYKIPSFGIVAIVDGDIEQKAITKRVRDVIKGNFKNPDQKDIVEKISNSITSFNLEFKSDLINALPEYNHKRWFEEITEEKVQTVNSNLQHGFASEKRLQSSLFELIAFSKSINDDHQLIKKEKGKPDYHAYYEIIKKDFTASNTDHKMNNLEWYILSCIKHYNNDKWQFYTAQVRQKIHDTYQTHRQKFVDSDFDFR